MIELGVEGLLGDRVSKHSLERLTNWKSSVERLERLLWNWIAN
jgi:hypothetical protein